MIADLHKARDKAGANTAKGRRLTVLSQLVQLFHVGRMDPDHERRVKGILQEAAVGVAAERGGAA